MAPENFCPLPETRRQPLHCAVRAVPNSSSSGKSGVPRAAVLIVAALAALLAGAELSLHFLLGLGNPVLVTPDPACDYILKPNQNVYRFFCHTHTNAWGMRSNPFPAVPDSGTLRVLFIGDSVTYGTSHVDQSKIFSEILHRELPSVLHRSVEVLNASAGGWAPDNEVSWLRSRGTFHSNVVLLVLNSGDLAQPRNRISGLGDDTPVRAPATAIGELWLRYLKPRFFHLAPRTDAGDVAQPNAETTIRANLTELETAASLASSQHARFAIVYIPFRKEIPQPAAESEAALRTWTAAHNVPLFDLTSVEASYLPKQISLDGDHLTADGHRIIAEAIEKQWASILAP